MARNQSERGKATTRAARFKTIGNRTATREPASRPAQRARFRVGLCNSGIKSMVRAAAKASDITIRAISLANGEIPTTKAASVPPAPPLSRPPGTPPQHSEPRKRRHRVEYAPETRDPPAQRSQRDRISGGVSRWKRPSSMEGDCISLSMDHVPGHLGDLLRVERVGRPNALNGADSVEYAVTPIATIANTLAQRICPNRCPINVAMTKAATAATPIHDRGPVGIINVSLTK